MSLLLSVSSQLLLRVSSQLSSKFYFLSPAKISSELREHVDAHAQYINGNNSRGKCRSCVCVKQRRVCTTCLLSRTGGCHNVGLPSCSPVIGPTPVSAPPLFTTPSTTISPPRHIIATSPLPSWNSIFSIRSSTLRHVPKGVRNSWADLLFHVFSAIIHNPSDLDNWLKLFLLPRCILANPPNGDRLGWRKLLKIVSSRIRKWERGDIPELWEELVSSTSSKNASM